MGNTSQSYEASPAIWDRTVLTATRHRWTRHVSIPARQVGSLLDLPTPEGRKTELTVVLIYRDGLPVRRQSPIRVVSNLTGSQINDLAIASLYNVLPLPLWWWHGLLSMSMSMLYWIYIAQYHEASLLSWIHQYLAKSTVFKPRLQLLLQSDESRRLSGNECSKPSDPQQRRPDDRTCFVETAEQ